MIWHGNVWEWVSESPFANNHVNCGGGYSDNGSDDNPARSRAIDFSTSAYEYLGFRVALYVI